MINTGSYKVRHYKNTVTASLHHFGLDLHARGRVIAHNAVSTIFEVEQKSWDELVLRARRGKWGAWTLTGRLILVLTDVSLPHPIEVLLMDVDVNSRVLSLRRV